MTLSEAEREVQCHVNALLDSKPDWAVFYREVLGVKGIVRRLYRSREAMEAFKKTQAYEDIQATLRRLRDSAATAGKAGSAGDAASVITVRIPQSLHEALREEAFEQRTSMNQLCISKLLRLLEGDAPAEESDRLEGGGVDL